QRVGEPGAWRVALAGSDDLSLVRQAAQRRAVQHPGAVAGEVGAVLALRPRQARGLRRFGYPPLTVEVVVGILLIRGHRPTVCQGDHRTCPQQALHRLRPRGSRPHLTPYGPATAGEID